MSMIFIKRPVFHQFLKFCLVGLESAVAYYFVFLLLNYILKINYLIASAVGFISGTLVGYKFNKIFSFDSKLRNTITLPIYLAVYSFSLIFTIFSMKYLVEILKITPIISILIVIFFTTIINFFGVKMLAFKNKKW